MAQITLNSTGVASSSALVLQSNGTTTAVTVSTAQIATFANDAVVNGLTVGRGGGAVASNTAVGSSALVGTNTGTLNTGTGYQALYTNTSGAQNTAVGGFALFSNTTGTSNTAVGTGVLGTYFGALGLNTTGSSNTAMGQQALYSNTTGGNNTGLGFHSLYFNTTASNNTAVGYQAGYNKTTNGSCTFIGYQAGLGVTTGTANTFIGAGPSGASGELVTTGSKNTILGPFQGNQGSLDIRTSDNYIVLSDGDGNPRMHNGGASAWTIAGTWTTTAVTPMNASSVASNPGTAAIWDGSGNLYKQSSSMRYKENIADWTVTDAQLDSFVNLNPKLWDYIGKENGCAGFIAEDIEALGLKNAYNTSPLINYSNEGEPDSNRDFALIALQHKVIQRLEAAVKELKAEFDAYKASHP